MAKLLRSTQMALPSGRATGSTAAFQRGAPSSDIATYANWSSSVLFDKFYRTGRTGTVTKTNVSTTILRSRAWGVMVFVLWTQICPALGPTLGFLHSSALSKKILYSTHTHLGPVLVEQSP
ncbi:hypothetical protein EMPS_09852 [Entomortierella parvispora]|uniref:Uncharacterized protein n=1 Tax=Entomortierella parvispora TaxID=205924 RepID=A0A9P3HJC6_9FUNG|nr:hypothetical protein EMPS_09852 [Entomortierella parvispora]